MTRRKLKVRKSKAKKAKVGKPKTGCHKYRIEWKENKPDRITACLTPSAWEKYDKRIAAKALKGGLRPAFITQIETEAERRERAAAYVVESAQRSKQAADAKRSRRVQTATVSGATLLMLAGGAAAVYWISKRSSS